MAPPVAAVSKSKVGLPWAERHRPRHLGEVIGNTDQVRKLALWLKDWDDVVLHGKVKEVPTEKKEWSTQKFMAAPENLNARAALISGPPGIGKTTTCCLVAKCNPRYKLMEFNASDARSKTIIEGMSNSLGGNHTLRLNADGKGAIERAVIIMDECDGMAGGGDKGGMQAMINMIKATKNPIICICNDRGDAQVRNLATFCYDIKFKRPENTVVAKRIKHMLDGEGRRVDLNALESVVEACGQDIRQVINHVQFFGSVGNGSQKDTQVMVSPFDACIKLLSGGEMGSKSLPMEKKIDMFYIDAELMPLMIQENYLRPCEVRKNGGTDDELSRCAEAAALIASADSMHDNWEVQSSAAVIGSIYPAFLTSSDEKLARPSFPAWLQKRAPMMKAERLVQEMQSKIKTVTTCSLRGLVTSSYHEVLHKKLLKPLMVGAAKEGAAALLAYGLTREFFTEQAPVLRQPLQLQDGYKTIDGKVKHQLLLEIQSLTQAAVPVKRKRDQQDEGGAVRRRGRFGGDTGRAGEDDAEHGEEDTSMTKKKGTQRGAKNKKSSTDQNSKCSLKGWVPQTTILENDQECSETPEAKKRVTLNMKYVDGHTIAVRRKVHVKDILGPWITL